MPRPSPHPGTPPPPLAVQKLRLRYAKRGRLRFTSVRDFQRALERALRRAEVPMAYSAGFSPHPKISYANAAPTGTASEAEYVEVSVIQRCDPESIRAALDSALPPGLDVVEVVEAAPTGAGSLADRLEASSWEIQLPGVTPSDAELALATFLARDEVLVERLTKNGMRTFDARAAVRSAAVAPSMLSGRPADETPAERGEPGTSGPCAILHMVVRHGTPSVRPDDVLTGLRLVADLVPPIPPRTTRLAQGPLEEPAGTVGDPFASDRLPAVQVGATPEVSGLNDAVEASA